MSCIFVLCNCRQTETEIAANTGTRTSAAHTLNRKRKHYSQNVKKHNRNPLDTLLFLGQPADFPTTKSETRERKKPKLSEAGLAKEKKRVREGKTEKELKQNELDESVGG